MDNFFETGRKMNSGIFEAIAGPRLSIPTVLIQMLGGDLEAAALLCQGVFLSEMLNNDRQKGWFCITQKASEADETAGVFFKNWELQLGISKDRQLVVRRKLSRLGLLEEEKRGLPCRLYYRFSKTRFLAFLDEKPECNSQFTENRSTGCGKSDQQVEGNSTNKSAAFPAAIKESFENISKDNKTLKTSAEQKNKTASGEDGFATSPVIASHGDEGEKEKSQPEKPVLQDAEPFLTLPLIGGKEFDVYPALIAELAVLYPAVNVEQEFRNMKGWLLANPKEKKTSAGIARFYTGWIAKNQNRHATGQPGNARAIGHKLTPGKWSGFEQKDYTKGINPDGTF